MTIERARATVVPKPWGVVDLQPWSTGGYQGLPIGEIWYERSADVDSEPSLLLKLLFTSQPLSIQVHPDDAYAQLIGLARGKTEAWYILSATVDGKVALGLKQPLTATQLLAALTDGSIVDRVSWRNVAPRDVVVVPAGTIHALGSGLVIAEIQQRVDATFRMFDFGRQRIIHTAHALAVAERGPASRQAPPTVLSNEREVLAANKYFAFERINLPAESEWLIEADRETWLLVLQGTAHVGSLDLSRGEALFAQSDRIGIRTGADALVCLAAYTGAGGAVSELLHRLSHGESFNERAMASAPTVALQMPTPRSAAQLEVRP